MIRWITSVIHPAQAILGLLEGKIRRLEARVKCIIRVIHCIRSMIQRLYPFRRRLGSGFGHPEGCSRFARTLCW